MEESQPPRAALVVDRFINVSPSETYGNLSTNRPLRGTYWKLVRLGDSPVAAAPKQREAYLMLANQDWRISGSGGCNRLIGSFELDGDRLRFSHVGTTMMACRDGMEQEKRFLDSLQRVDRYRIHGSHLELLNANGEVVARFEAVVLN